MARRERREAAFVSDPRFQERVREWNETHALLDSLDDEARATHENPRVRGRAAIDMSVRDDWQRLRQAFDAETHPHVLAIQALLLPLGDPEFTRSALRRDGLPANVIVVLLGNVQESDASVLQALLDHDHPQVVLAALMAYATHRLPLADHAARVKALSNRVRGRAELPPLDEPSGAPATKRAFRRRLWQVRRDFARQNPV